MCNGPVGLGANLTLTGSSGIQKNFRKCNHIQGIYLGPVKRSPNKWTEYQLIDHGREKKLERFGSVVTIRPEPNAIGSAHMKMDEWLEMAHAEFIQETPNSGRWDLLKDIPDNWNISYQLDENELIFNLRLTKFKHLGVFPEQAVNWEKIYNKTKEGGRFLNLFAYTGGASLAAKCSGSEVFHVESVKQVISWAKENMYSSGLSDIRWVLEDALKFTERELKRKNTYDMIVLDPPAFGRGPKGEVWKLGKSLDHILKNCSQLLKVNGSLILNVYSPTINKRQIAQYCDYHFRSKKKELGDLWLKDEQEQELFMGVYAWIN